MNIAFISAVLPVVVLLVYVYRKDRSQPEPLRKLIWTFLVGCMSVVPAMLMERALMPLLPPAYEMPVFNGLLEGYVVAGLSEELCKLLLLLLVIWRSREFDEYFDGIVYATFLAMGFACVENMGYVFGSGDAIGTALMRGVLAVPAHFLFAVTMGYHVSLAKFDPKHRSRHLLHALLYPVLMHGTYDSLLMVSNNLTVGNTGATQITGLLCTVLFGLFVWFDIKMWRWGLRRIAQMQSRTHHEDYIPTDPFANFHWDL